jgi:hypothetical protein
MSSSDQMEQRYYLERTRHNYTITECIFNWNTLDTVISIESSDFPLCHHFHGQSHSHESITVHEGPAWILRMDRAVVTRQLVQS